VAFLGERVVKKLLRLACVPTGFHNAFFPVSGQRGGTGTAKKNQKRRDEKVTWTARSCFWQLC